MMRPVSEETALGVLQAAVEEAHGRAGVYVTRDRVMERVNLEDSKHFKAIDAKPRGFPSLLVVVEPEVGYELLASYRAQGVLQLHQLDK
jgi:hypothetical protein